MVETILEITTTKADGTSLSIKVTAEETTNQQIFPQIDVLEVTLIADGVPVGVISFDPVANSLQLSGMSLHTGSYVACLAACGLGHLVTHILDCRAKGNTTIKQLLTCLKSKGHTISGSLLNCLIQCLPSLAGIP